MPKPSCLCTGRTDIACNEEGCSIAVPPQKQAHTGCVVCWQYHYSNVHRKLFGGEGPAKEPPLHFEISLPIKREVPQISEEQVKKLLPTQIEQQQHVLRAGDRVESLLSSIGITKERVSRFVGAPCGCAERRDKMNQISDMAEDIAKGAIDKAKSLAKKLFGV